MFDIFVYRVQEAGVDPIYYVECDGQIQERVFLHLQTYNLRTNTSISMVNDDEDFVVSCSTTPLEGSLALTKDTRSDWSFNRQLFRSSVFKEVTKDYEFFTEGRYHRERILRGVPEGAFEIQSKQSIPFEFNIDVMGGIDFNKGCYLGQELVTRTHHRGVVRKRILPLKFHALDSKTLIPQGIDNDSFRFDASCPLTRNLDKQSEFLPASTTSPLDPESPFNVSSGKLRILSRTDSVGKLIMAQGNIGIGLMRLDTLKNSPELKKNMAVFDHVTNDWVLADTEIPSWWPPTLFANL